MSRREDLKRIAELMAQMDNEHLLIVRALLLIRISRKWVAVQGAALLDRAARPWVIGGTSKRKGER